MIDLEVNMKEFNREIMDALWVLHQWMIEQEAK